MRIHGEEYDAAVQRLRERAGASWGDDGLFAIVNQVWAQCSQTIVATKSALSDEVRDTGGGLTTVARNIRDADTAATMPEDGAWV